MYRKLQQQAKEYILEKLNNNPDNLKFTIDTSNPNITNIICHSQTESINVCDKNIGIPDYVFECIEHILPFKIGTYRTEWSYFIRWLVRDIFKIYGFDIVMDPSTDKYFIMMNMYIPIYQINYNKAGYGIVTPFVVKSLDDLLLKLVSNKPLLILLDPIYYFYCGSLVLKENSINMKRLSNIYDAFLAKFPEMNYGLFRNYLMVYIILGDYCRDMRFMILAKLVGLYDYELGKN